jgi:hypothetical protein
MSSGTWSDVRALQCKQMAKEHAEGGQDVCFVIHRSNNDNTVIYKGDEEKGLNVFWIMCVVVCV